VWQCALCNNQFRVQERRRNGQWETFRNFKQMFEKRMDHTKRILSLMAPWDSPKNLSRIWCVFETYMALRRGHHFEVIWPDEEDEKFQHALETGGMQPIWDLFGKVDIQQAEAAAEADKQHILRLVDSNLSNNNLSEYSVKCEEVNAAVVKHLQRWFVKLAVDSISDRRRKGHQIPLEAFDNVAWLLSTVRDDEASWEQTTQMYDFALKAARDRGSTTTEAYASVLTKYAVHLGRVNDAVARDRCLDEAGAVLTQIQATNTVTYADYLKAVALRHRTVGEYDSQRQLLEQARDVLRRNRLTTTPSYAAVLRYLNQSYAHNGTPFRERMDIFQEAQDVWESIGCKYSMGYAGLLMDMAMAVYRSRDPRAAEWFEMARKIYVRLGATQSAEYASLVQKIGRHRVHHNRHQEGLRNFQEAYEIHRNVRMTETRNHAFLLADLASCQMVLGNGKGQSTFRQAHKLVNKLQDREEETSTEHATLGRLRDKLKRLQGPGRVDAPQHDPVQSASDDELDQPVPLARQRQGMFPWLCGGGSNPGRVCFSSCLGSGCMAGLRSFCRRSVPPASEPSQHSPRGGCGQGALRASVCACCTLGLFCALHG